MTKAARMAKKLFPGAPRYTPKRRTYSAIPWLLRCGLGLFTPREFMLLVYLHLRAGPEQLVWHGEKQIAADLDIGHRKLSPHFKKLEEKQFIRTREHDGVRYTLLLDPERALRFLAQNGKLSERMFEAINDDFETLGLEPLIGPATKPTEVGS
jgi:DNA-binding MarR family transcriptional regulator